MGALSFLRESLFAEEHALKQGFLQSIDARIKAISIFLLVIAALLTKNIIFLISFYLFSLILAYVSRIKIGFFLKRTWIFIPLFSFFIALPALFQFFTPGEPLWKIPFLFGKELIITKPGLYSAGLFVSRVITCVSFVILLSLTTRHAQLLKVLRIFRIPQVFVMTIGMCYRYIYLFIEVLENTYKAINSRVGRSLHYKKGQEIVTSSIANLWQRSYQLNNEVYNAMLSRGYTGEPRVLEEFRSKLRDWIWLLAVSLIFVLSVYINYA
jgi:cobalt/nickel transport system permease protein